MIFIETQSSVLSNSISIKTQSSPNWVWKLFQQCKKFCNFHRWSKQMYFTTMTNAKGKHRAKTECYLSKKIHVWWRKHWYEIFLLKVCCFRILVRTSDVRTNEVLLYCLNNALIATINIGYDVYFSYIIISTVYILQNFLEKIW